MTRLGINHVIIYNDSVNFISKNKCSEDGKIGKNCIESCKYLDRSVLDHLKIIHFLSKSKL